MNKGMTLGEALKAQGVSRRGFLKFCAGAASLMALPQSMVPAIAAALEQAKRPSVIWLSFQECTGCTESLTRAHAPTIEGLIFDAISLDYHHTLQAAAGEAAEAAREEAMRESHGNYLLVVDGSIPLGNPGFSTIAGVSNLEMLKEVAAGAAAVIAVGSCAAFGGLPNAAPNPTGAVPVTDIVTDKPVINVPGCPPIPEAMISGTMVHYLLSFGSIPELDAHGPAQGLFRRKLFMTAATGGRSTSRASSPRPSTTKAHARAGACSSWAARGRSPTMPAPRSSGMKAPVFPSSRATAAWAAPSPASGIWEVSTRPCPCHRAMWAPPWPRRRLWAWRLARPSGPSTACASRPMKRPMKPSPPMI